MTTNIIRYEAARALIAQAARRQSAQPVHRLPCTELSGQVVAIDIRAPIHVQPFDNAAMDGFALPAQLTAHASAAQPCTLPIRHVIAAGDNDHPAQGTGDSAPDGAFEIMTGAKIPAGCDAVIPVEEVTLLTDQAGAPHVQISRPVAWHEHIRCAGEDFRAGHLIAPQGTRLHAGHVAAMSAAGLGMATVYQMPHVGILTTGKEVSDDYGIPLVGSQIYNSNTPYLLSQLHSAGIPATTLGHIGDDPARCAELLAASTDTTILISTGAVSKGRWDFLPDVLAQQGAEIVFHRVAIRPGKPILFAVLRDGRYFFGLPGNPVAAAVGLRFFVQPLIRHLLGMRPEVYAQARLAAPIDKKGPFRHFLKARTSVELGTLMVTALAGQESFKIAPMCQMNAWVVVEEHQQQVSGGTLLSVASLSAFPDNE